MDFKITDEGEDFATIEVYPGQDDRFEVSGYANRGEIRLCFSVYSHEAKELIELLGPIADREEQEVGL